VPVSRAAFLKIIGMAIAGVRIGPAAFACTSVDRFDASMFQPHLGESFSVFPENGSPVARVRLAKIEERSPSNRVTQFSLIFHATTREPLADGIHEFRHPALGSFSIFISSIGTAAAEPRVHQACFSCFMRT
jgi:Domain of unknown function (DUF6916)